MIDKINDFIYSIVEKLWGMPEDIFDLEDEENDIIEY